MLQRGCDVAARERRVDRAHDGDLNDLPWGL
jgi:hypothetical protein